MSMDYIIRKRTGEEEKISANSTEHAVLTYVERLEHCYSVYKVGNDTGASITVEKAGSPNREKTAYKLVLQG